MFDSDPLLVFGAHPDDIEFGCGGIVALESKRGRKVHLYVCSRGETGTHGSPEQREQEARNAARILGAEIEFFELDGDAHLEVKVEHAIKIAEIIRRIRPSSILAPSHAPNQHPDHSRLGLLVRDACRLARYGGLKELKGSNAHSIRQLFYYAVTPEGEPEGVSPSLFDISNAEIVQSWTEAMQAHLTQTSSRNYVELQLARARVWGERAGVQYAMALYSNDPLIFESLAGAGRGARQY